MSKLLLKHKLFIFFTIFLYFLQATSRSVYLLFIGLVIDKISSIQNNNYLDFIIYLIILLVAIFLSVFFKWYANLQRIKTVNKITIELRYDIAKKITSMPIKSYVSSSYGKQISWLNYDVNEIQNGFLNGIFGLANDFFNIIASLIIFSYFAWQVLLTVFGINIIFFMLPILFGPFLQKIQQKWSKNSENLSNSVLKNLEAYNTFYFANKTNLFKYFFTKSIDDFNTTNLQIYKKGIFFKNVINFGNTFAAVSIMISTIFFAKSSVISFGFIFSTLALGTNISQYFLGFIASLLGILSQKLILKKFYDKSEIVSDLTKKEKINNFYSLELSNLEYSYGDKKILSNFSLNIHKNKKYLIVGKSGSGKSTFLYILLGILNDYKGSVKLNNIELKDIDEECLHNLMGYVDSKNFLFNDTIKNNIKLWANDKLDTSKAKKEANINEIKDSYEIEELKNTLSEGQKQRINLAREFYNKKPILILDEATANLDYDNSNEIEKMLLKNNDLTLIMVTHHPKKELIKLFDEIIYF